MNGLDDERIRKIESRLDDIGCLITLLFFIGVAFIGYKYQ